MGNTGIENMIGLSVVIPCYNEEAVLPELIRRVSAVCDAFSPGNYEIILVNDGSKDASWQLISDYADSLPHVTGIDLSRNYGHQLALSAGLKACRGEYILILDADLQDPPELLPDMFCLMQQGYDVVYGQRTHRSGETLFKRASAALFYRLLQKLVDVVIPPDTGDFRLMSRRVCDQLNAMPERYRFVRGMISWIGFNQIAIPYQRDARFAGTTHYPLRKMLSFALDAVTSFSVMPLRFASHLGILFGLCGLLALGWVGLSYLTAGVVAGWTSLAALILILGSVQLLLLGVFGEYLGRMYMESKQRPSFIVRELRSQRITTTNPVHRMTDTIRRQING